MTRQPLRPSFGGDRVASLPVVHRELRIASNRFGTYWARVLVALTSTVFIAYALLVTSATGVNNSGRMLFQTCTSLGYLYCIIVGLRNTADCISVEKRDGTIGLLLLTHLRGFDVILGKLFATGLNSIYGLLAGFPVLAISLVLGGVTGVEFGQAMLAMLQILFVSHAIGLTASVFSTEARHAYRNAILLVVGIYLASFGIAYGLHQLSNAVPQLRGVTVSRSIAFWGWLIAYQAVGWGLLAFAGWRLTYVCQPRGSKVRWRWIEFWNRWRYGSSTERLSHRQTLLNENPFFWLTSRAYRRPLAVLSVCILFTAGLISFAILTNGNSLSPDERLTVTASTVTGLYLITVIWIASEASRHLAEHRQNGSLELLLCTTNLRVPEIVAGHWMTLRRQFFWPIVAIVCLAIVSAVVIHRPGVKVYLLYIAGLLVIDSVAIAWVGMWQGLSAKPRHAIGNTIFRLLLLPPLLAVLMARFSPFSFPVLFAITKILINGFFIVRSNHKLLTDFRLYISPQEEPRGIFAALGRIAGKKVATLRTRDRKVEPSF